MSVTTSLIFKIKN